MTTSLLSVPGATTAHSVGLVPVGEVMGCAVAHLGWTGWNGCMAGGIGSGYGSGYTSGVGGSPIVDGFPPYVAAVRGGYATALARLEAEARALGAHGVIGVGISVALMDAQQHEFVMLGTAVRFLEVKESVPRIFVTELPGADVSALLRSGWLPASILIGVAISVRHDDWTMRMQSSLGAGNQEVVGLTQLTSQVRDRGRQSMIAQASTMDGVLVTSQRLNVWEQEPSENHRDHVAEMRMFGTGLIKLAAPTTTPTTLTVLPLRSMPVARKSRLS